MLTTGMVLSNEFEVLRPLASGGMGSVYLVRQLSTGAVRALKVMQSSLSRDPEASRRFEREARVGSRIRSDHVVEVIAAGTHGNLPWIVMEQLEGLTLSAALDQWGPPGKADGQRVTEQLFHAISAAHAAQVVHRDLKPENIFLNQLHTPGGGFSVKVLDFGIAKWLGSDTATAALGTWSWAAPEQGLSSGSVGLYTDVWALGLVVFWLLTGSEFWKGGGGAVGVLSQVHLNAIPKASERARELGSSCPIDAAFDRWFARCVNRQVDERYPNASEAWSALSTLALPWNPHAHPWQLTSGGRSASIAFDATERSGEGQPSGTSPPTFVAEQLLVPTRNVLTPRIGAVVIAVVALGYAGYRASGARSSAKVAEQQPEVPEFTHGMVRLRAAAGTDAQREFWLDPHEVTVAEYERCVQRSECTASQVANAENATDADALCNRASAAAAAPTGAARQNHPINCVNWYQATTYCRSVGKRLPTEQEWLLAAEGTEHRNYPWGNRLLQSCDDAVVSGLCSRSPSGTREVGTRSPNSASPEGVLDLVGNVWEWVDEGRNVTAGYGVLSGGGWDSSPQNATSTSRDPRPKGFADVNTGFRCAYSLR